MATDEERLCRAFAGEPMTYRPFRKMADVLPWQDLWPEVDGQMRLTGRVVDSSSTVHVNVGDQAMMPMSEAKSAGYEVEDGRLVP